MWLVTPAFLGTTPEASVPALGDLEHRFPYLSGWGRLVIKDVIMMGAVLIKMADSAHAYLARVRTPGVAVRQFGEESAR